MGKKKKKSDRAFRRLDEDGYRFAVSHTQEHDFDALSKDAIELFRAVGTYAVKVRSLVPADNRSTGHLLSPMHVEGMGDICMLLVMDDAGFSPEGVNDDGTFEVGIFVASAQMAKSLGGTGRAAHAIGAMMLDAEEQDGAS